MKKNFSLILILLALSFAQVYASTTSDTIAEYRRQLATIQAQYDAEVAVVNTQIAAHEQETDNKIIQASASLEIEKNAIIAQHEPMLSSQECAFGSPFASSSQECRDVMSQLTVIYQKLKDIKDPIIAANVGKHQALLDMRNAITQKYKAPISDLEQKIAEQVKILYGEQSAALTQERDLHKRTDAQILQDKARVAAITLESNLANSSAYRQKKFLVLKKLLATAGYECASVSSQSKCLDIEAYAESYANGDMKDGTGANIQGYFRLSNREVAVALLLLPNIAEYKDLMVWIDYDIKKEVDAQLKKEGMEYPDKDFATHHSKVRPDGVFVVPAARKPAVKIVTQDAEQKSEIPEQSSAASASTSRETPATTENPPQEKPKSVWSKILSTSWWNPFSWFSRDAKAATQRRKIFSSPDAQMPASPEK